MSIEDVNVNKYEMKYAKCVTESVLGLPEHLPGAELVVLPLADRGHQRGVQAAGQQHAVRHLQPIRGEDTVT